MPCKGPVQKYPVVDDPVYDSPPVLQLVNKALLDGKKSTAERIVYGILELCEERTSIDPVLTLKCAVENVRPALEIRSHRVGGATYQVPVGARLGRDTTLTLRWLLMFPRQRRENTMIERFVNEILDVSNGLSASIKRHEDTHKMAEASRTLARYHW